MIANSWPFSKIISIDQGAREHYHVPKYQREYTWGKRHWEQLLTDIDENDLGYFMGSVICIKESSEESGHRDELIYEVIDGQQRLTTLSLLMMAVYNRLSTLRGSTDFEEEEDRQEFENTLSSLRNKLVKKKKKDEYREGERGGWKEQDRMCFLRVQPSEQNSNYDDYLYLLGALGLIKERPKPYYHGVRSIAKAFRFFEDEIPEDAAGLLTLVRKINELVFVHLSVGSQADAFTLFETLNNRGMPLSAIDIIKNKILAEMDRQHQVDVDESFEKWQKIIEAIPEPSDQERFLRHFYNAYRWKPEIKVEGIPKAIKSKIIHIYERLIKKDALPIFEMLCEKARLYGQLVSPTDGDFDEGITSQLVDLARINAAPANLLLLYLFSLSKKYFADKDFMEKAVTLLQKYYVRRNVTDFPGTRALDQINIDLVEAFQTQLDQGNKLSIAYFEEQLLQSGRCSSLANFEESLRGPMYDTNVLMTRYLLVKLDETYHSREYAPDFWIRNDDEKYIWTVEHVLPQTTNIPKEWVDMLGNGDRSEAKRIHLEHVDRLGNLTLSGYNSRLSTASFTKKQKLSETKKVFNHEIHIGFGNGLGLNKLAFKVSGGNYSLANAPEWTEQSIEARTNAMTKLLLKKYKFDSE